MLELTSYKSNMKSHGLMSKSKFGTYLQDLFRKDKKQLKPEDSPSLEGKSMSSGDLSLTLTTSSFDSLGNFAKIDTFSYGNLSQVKREQLIDELLRTLKKFEIIYQVKNEDFLIPYMLAKSGEYLEELKKLITKNIFYERQYKLTFFSNHLMQRIMTRLFNENYVVDRKGKRWRISIRNKFSDGIFIEFPDSKSEIKWFGYIGLGKLGSILGGESGLSLQESNSLLTVSIAKTDTYGAESDLHQNMRFAVALLEKIHYTILSVIRNSYNILEITMRCIDPSCRHRISYSEILSHLKQGKCRISCGEMHSFGIEQVAPEVFFPELWLKSPVKLLKEINHTAEAKMCEAPALLGNEKVLVRYAPLHKLTSFCDFYRRVYVLRVINDWRIESPLEAYFEHFPLLRGIHFDTELGEHVSRTNLEEEEKGKEERGGEIGEGRIFISKRDDVMSSQRVQDIMKNSPPHKELSLLLNRSPLNSPSPQRSPASPSPLTDTSGRASLGDCGRLGEKKGIEVLIGELAEDTYTSAAKLSSPIRAGMVLEEMEGTSLRFAIEKNMLHTFFPSKQASPHLLVAAQLSSALYFLQDCQVILSALSSHSIFLSPSPSEQSPLFKIGEISHAESASFLRRKFVVEASLFDKALTRDNLLPNQNSHISPHSDASPSERISMSTSVPSISKLHNWYDEFKKSNGPKNWQWMVSPFSLFVISES